MFDDEYNDYEEYENFDNSEEIIEAAERAREAMLEKSVHMNYHAIVEKGALGSDLKRLPDNEFMELVETIEFMIEFYEKREAYERCAILVKFLEAVKTLSDFEPVVDIY
jgi:hypothetical protein